MSKPADSRFATAPVERHSALANELSRSQSLAIQERFQTLLEKDPAFRIFSLVVRRTQAGFVLEGLLEFAECESILEPAIEASGGPDAAETPAEQTSPHSLRETSPETYLRSESFRRELIEHMHRAKKSALDDAG